MNALLGATWETELEQILETRYFRFHSPLGIKGLAKERDKGESLWLLAVESDEPNRGNFSKFIESCKQEYRTIFIAEVWNGVLKKTLLRKGFREEHAIDPDVKERVNVMRWDK